MSSHEHGPLVRLVGQRPGCWWRHYRPTGEVGSVGGTAIMCLSLLQCGPALGAARRIGTRIEVLTNWGEWLTVLEEATLEDAAAWADSQFGPAPDGVTWADMIEYLEAEATIKLAGAVYVSGTGGSVVSGRDE